MNDGQEDIVDHLSSDVVDRPIAGSPVSSACEDGPTGSPEQLTRRSKRKRRRNSKYGDENYAGVRNNPVSRRVAVIRDQVERDGLAARAVTQVACRICLQEGVVGELDNPCACTGSMQYAHWGCVQKWLLGQGGTVCEICQQPYKKGYRTLAQIIRSTNLLFADRRRKKDTTP